eukprot:403367306
MAYKYFKNQDDDPLSPENNIASKTKFFINKHQSLIDPSPINHTNRTFHYDQLLQPFNKIFLDDKMFRQVGQGQNLPICGKLKLQDRKGGLKFMTQSNAQNQMSFYFQKKHTSKHQRNISMKSLLRLDPDPNLKVCNENFFNYHQEIDNNPDLDCIWFQNQLNILPQPGEQNLNYTFMTQFRQTLLLQVHRNLFFGGQLSYLREKTFKLIFYHEAQRMKFLFEAMPIEQNLFFSLLYKTKIQEIFGVRVKYNHRVPQIQRFVIDFLHCYPLKQNQESYIINQLTINQQRIFIKQMIRHSFSEGGLNFEVGQRFSHSGDYQFGMSIEVNIGIQNDIPKN